MSTVTTAYFFDDCYSLGGKTLQRIQKYQVDVLGNYAPVRLPEKRQRFRQ
jgi:hypothetical protein